MSTTAWEVRLAARPVGKPTLDDFELAEVPVPHAGPGQVVVRNLVMSVDPYMRGRMNDAKSYAPPYRLGQPLEGGAVGVVVESTVDSHRAGDTVLHGFGWREYALLDAAGAAKIDPNLAPLGAFLGVLGMPGLTAYAGLVEVAQLAEGDTVFVSSAAGAVGSAAGQIAKLKGAKLVIGSAGSARKVDHLRDELGFDRAFNYRDRPVLEALTEAAPDGIDVYFDNVGGDHLEAAIATMNTHGRIAVCGMISVYNATSPNPAPRNLHELIAKRITMRGMLVADHTHLRPAFFEEVGAWIRDGALTYTETTVDGIHEAPAAFLAMLDGQNLGKMLVKLAD
jgi:NADPH-dependent curcumin reductase CurA